LASAHGRVGFAYEQPDSATDTTALTGTDRQTLTGHAGVQAVAVARRHGVRAMFTLSGAHVFPLYDGAVTATPPMPLIDVRHEQTAVFAAEATAKLTRSPGLAVLTAGPGVTNGVSAVTTAHFNGSPLLVLGGRAPAFRWGTGSLQELDHPPLLAPVTKRSATIPGPDRVAADVDAALRLAMSPHRGPVFLDVSMDHAFTPATVELPPAPLRQCTEPDAEALDTAAAALAEAKRPVLVLGSDVWADGAEAAARELVAELGLPVVANGMGRGILPPADPRTVTRARSTAFRNADVVLVVGTPLDFRLGYGVFGGKAGAPPARVVHVADTVDAVSRHADLAAGIGGDLTLALNGLRSRLSRKGLDAGARAWAAELRAAHDAAIAADAPLLSAAGDGVHPVRVYGELLPRLAHDAVVIGDGGDFVSFAGKYVEPATPGSWLDPGPYGCLGTAMGYAIAARLARPTAQVVVLIGDGAAGLSLMDVDTLVRHRLPAVLVVGNNGMWGLEKWPMRMLYGYDVAAELAPRTRYDGVVRALGGGGELVTRPQDVGPALDRAFAECEVTSLPYCVNVVTDPTVAYPRSTTGI
jgi:acetolactate synthase-1/2/3 large subunit